MGQRQSREALHIKGHLPLVMLVIGVGLLTPRYSNPARVPSSGRGTTSVAAGVNGPLLVTAARGGTYGSALLAVTAGHAPRVLVAGLPSRTTIGPSPRGRYIALAEGAHGLWIVKSDGTGLHKRIEPPPSSSPRTHRLVISAVAWSPDRYTLAYAVTEDVFPNGRVGLYGYEQDPRGGVWVLRYNGGTPRHIATFAQLAYEIFGVSWSSDGRLIAVDNNGVVGVIDTVTGRVTANIIDGAGAFSPTAPVLASPDNGNGLCVPATSQPPRGLTLCAVDAQGRHERILSRDTTRSGGPDPTTLAGNLAWAPDGWSIAYSWRSDPPSSRIEIHVLEIATGHVRIVRLASPWRLIQGGASSVAWLHTPL